jgi:O-antigen/teichoic acid export membrane protein
VTEVAESPLTVRAQSVQLLLQRNTAVTAGVQTLATNAFQVAGLFLLTAIIARLLGPEGKGAYDLYTNAAALIQIALGMSLPSGLTYVVASRRVNIDRLLLSVFWFCAAEGVVAAAAVTLLMRGRHGAVLVPQALRWGPVLIGATVTAVALSTSFRAVLVGDRRFAAANSGDIFKQITILFLVPAAFFLCNSMGLSVLTGVVAGNIAAVVATASLYMGLARKTCDSDGQDSGLGPTLRFAFPCYLGSIAQFLNYRLDVFFVSGMLGSRQLGIYMVAVLLAQSVNLVPGAAQAVLFPTVAAVNDDRANAIKTTQATRFLLWFGILLGGALAAGGPLLITYVFGPAFAEAVRPLWWLLPGAVIFVIANVIAGYFAGTGRPNLNALASVVGVCITVPLDLILIPKFGISGAALASTASYTTSALAMMVLFCRSTATPPRRLFLPVRGDRDLLMRILASAIAWTRRNRGSV